MHTYYEVKDMLKRELEDITRRGEITERNLEIIDTLLNSIKNSCKIIMYEEYAEEDGGYSSRSGYSNARGRRGNVRRDSMGRYSREGGYSYEDGKEQKKQMLRELMNEANSEEEKEMIKRLMQYADK